MPRDRRPAEGNSGSRCRSAMSGIGPGPRSRSPCPGSRPQDFPGVPRTRQCPAGAFGDQGRGVHFPRPIRSLPISFLNNSAARRRDCRGHAYFTQGLAEIDPARKDLLLDMAEGVEASELLAKHRQPRDGAALWRRGRPDQSAGGPPPTSIPALNRRLTFARTLPWRPGPRLFTSVSSTSVTIPA